MSHSKSESEILKENRNSEDLEWKRSSSKALSCGKLFDHEPPEDFKLPPDPSYGNLYLASNNFQKPMMPFNVKQSIEEQMIFWNRYQKKTC
jgi:hypothetical protein